MSFGLFAIDVLIYLVCYYIVHFVKVSTDWVPLINSAMTFTRVLSLWIASTAA